MATFSSKVRKAKQIYQKQNKSRQITSTFKTTVEGRHLEMLKKFKEEQCKLLPQKEKTLNTREKQYERLINKKSKGKLEPVEYNMMSDFKREIKVLETEIQRLQNNLNENDYLLNVADILEDYDEITSTSNEKTKQPKEGNIFDFLTASPTNNDNNDNNDKKNKGIKRYIDISDRHEKTRGDMLDELMQLTDKDYVSERIPKDRVMECLCDIPDGNKLIFNFTTGTHICEGCGVELTHFYDSQFTSYKESQEHDVPVDFPYVRMNHFNELIAQFQAKEQTDIPDEVFYDLRSEFKKESISSKKDFNNLHYKLVKKKLQKLGHTNMYEHIPYIIHKFNGLPPPILTLENEQKFRIMFKQIQEPFERCKHLAKKNRKNFLSYSYVFYKFAELLELDQLLSCFRLLKSREKLFAQDKVWKAICEIKEWQFIPSL